MDLTNGAGDENGQVGKNFYQLWWWEPPRDCLPFDFCRDTSLHGLKYLYQPRRHLSERIFWFLAFFTSLTLTVFMILELWNKYRSTPIIVSFETFETTVDEIPFPAVTICNMNKVQKRKAEELIKTLHDNLYTPEFDAAQKSVYLLHHVCNVSSGFSKVFNFSLARGAVPESDLNLRNNTNYSNETENDQLDIEKFLQIASPKCPEMLPLCIWHDEVQNCTKLFNPIETDFGKCCTFNMVSQSLLHQFRNDSRDDPEEIRQWSEWDLDTDGILIRDDHDKDGNTRKFPRRQKLAGKSFGLSILLDPDLDEYFCTTSDSVGFRLATHLSVDVPHVADFGIAIAPNSEVFVNVRPEITTAEESIRHFPLNKRRCYFPNEHPLQYYNYYTTSNCIDECIAEKTFDICNCVRYYMPRDDDKPLCGPDKFTCAEQVKSSQKTYLLQGLKSNCVDCLRPCSEIQYLMETTATKIEDLSDDWQYENGSYARWRYNNVSIVHIFIGQPSTYARVRKEIYGWSDLMAQTGGIMGLCLGFSGLSLVELVYYLTLRPWWQRKWREHYGAKVLSAVINAWTRSKSKSNGHNLQNDAGLNRKTSFNSHLSLHPGNIRQSIRKDSRAMDGVLPIIAGHYHGNNNNNDPFQGQNVLLNEINNSISMSRLRLNGGAGACGRQRSIYSELGQLRPEHGNPVDNETSARALFNEIAPYYNNVQNSQRQQQQNQYTSSNQYWNV